MRIVFNLQAVGLGNNGGSRTLIKCAEVLQDLGHEVTLWCSANNYKWSKVKVLIMSKMPQCDVIIATGYSSVPSTVAAKVKRKFYYIRGFELWRASKTQLLCSYKSLNCVVNSEWLLKYLHSKGVAAHLIYPGVDFDIFGKDTNNRKNILGGLYSKKHATKRHEDVIKVGKHLGYQVQLLNRDIVNPAPSTLRDFYNRIKVWLSPSELEGLHNCPLEAALCGSSLVATDHRSGGVSDYAIDKNSALIYPARQLEVAGQCVKQLMEDSNLRDRLGDNMQRLLKDKIGSREHNMKKLIKIFEEIK